MHPFHVEDELVYFNVVVIDYKHETSVIYVKLAVPGHALLWLNKKKLIY